MENALYEEIDRLKAENEKLKSEIETYEKLWEQHDGKIFHLLMDATDLARQVQKWKSTVEEYRAALALAERDRDYWQDMAMEGGGNG